MTWEAKKPWSIGRVAVYYNSDRAVKFSVKYRSDSKECKEWYEDWGTKTLTICILGKMVSIYWAKGKKCKVIPYWMSHMYIKPIDHTFYGMK